MIGAGGDGCSDWIIEQWLPFYFQDDKPESIQKVANKIAHVAHELSFDPDYMSPFAFNAAANGFQNVKGM